MTDAEFMIDTVVKNIAITKDIFKEIIIDQKYPLEERWKFWSSAPTFLKEEECYITSFDIEDKNGGIEWFEAPYYKEKNETIELSDFIENIEWDIKYSQEKPGNHKAGTVDLWPQNSIDEFKEEVLRKNLHSFVLDW